MECSSHNFVKYDELAVALRRLFVSLMFTSLGDVSQKQCDYVSLYVSCTSVIFKPRLQALHRCLTANTNSSRSKMSGDTVSKKGIWILEYHSTLRKFGKDLATFYYSSLRK